ncbi:MAG: hypothetical protein ACOY0T_35925 [Myxococcota bacterium]
MSEQNQIRSLGRQTRQAFLFAALTGVAWLTIAPGCSDPFESCVERRACPIPPSEEGGAGGQPPDDRGDGGSSGGTSEGGHSPVSGGQGGGAGSGMGGAVPQSTGGVSFETGGTAGEAAAGALNAGHGGTLVGQGGTGAAQGGAAQGGAAQGGAAQGGAVGAGGATGWGSCVLGETKLCSQLFPTISQCGGRRVTCMSNLKWPDASAGCVPGRRDCASVDDNDCDGSPDNTRDETCQCAVGGAPQACNLVNEPDCARGQSFCVQDAQTLASSWENTCRLPPASPTYSVNRATCPNNAILGTTCTTTSGEPGTMQSKCATSPSTCGTLYCIAN